MLVANSITIEVIGINNFPEIYASPGNLKPLIVPVRAPHVCHEIVPLSRALNIKLHLAGCQETSCPLSFPLKTSPITLAFVDHRKLCSSL